ncbi:NUDIX domain-containing protein [Arthrobacter sp. I2-34]|uniref:NUDIX domain-containing protein n=1 Tax=Arthrobacter hankyongi TaxID=2904801 RepID=A0ABS9L2E0_9MICC|nr:NUDIX domain-containing protein [Arthrobacter hankyongi]MCG2620862.1 NUDIX domain-containing protein [Arthrobacter hankyongi]
MTICDNSSKTLTDYPRPSVAVDTAVLTVRGDQLSVLVVAHDKAPGFEWALPGTFLHEGERLADAVLRSLRDKAGITGRTPQQLYVFDDPARDPRGWVLSVAHVDMVPLKELERALENDGVKLLSVSDGVPGLPYDHTAIVERAMQWMRDQYEDQPDPGLLLEEPFTLRDLRMLHDAVKGEARQRDTFRRLMVASGEIMETGEMTGGGRGRPSRLWVRR